jgi:hypothetical protein
MISFRTRWIQLAQLESRALRDRAARRAGGVIAILLLVGGPLVQIVDTLSHRHEICQEHGEIVHVYDRETTASESCGTPSHDREPLNEHCAISAGVVLAAPREDEAASHDHDHCVVAGSALKRALVVAPQADWALPGAGARFAPTETDGPSHSALALYLIAPKNSPPLV